MNNMTRSQKTTSAPSNEAIITIDDHVRCSDIFKQSEGSRTFEYKLDDKATKAKLIKAAKRSFIVEVNSTSCNLVFNAGAWHIAKSAAAAVFLLVVNACYVGPPGLYQAQFAGAT